jgi:hypothetical protein
MIFLLYAIIKLKEALQKLHTPSKRIIDVSVVLFGIRNVKIAFENILYCYSMYKAGRLVK